MNSPKKNKRYLNYIIITLSIFFGFVTNSLASDVRSVIFYNYFIYPIANLDVELTFSESNCKTSYPVRVKGGDGVILPIRCDGITVTKIQLRLENNKIKECLPYEDDLPFVVSKNGNSEVKINAGEEDCQILTFGPRN